LVRNSDPTTLEIGIHFSSIETHSSIFLGIKLFAVVLKNTVFL